MQLDGLLGKTTTLGAVSNDAIGTQTKIQITVGAACDIENRTGFDFGTRWTNPDSA